MKRTPEKQAEIEKLPKYWVRIQSQSEKSIKYNYTKLVPARKAYEMVHGKLDEFGKRTQKLKHRYQFV